MVVSLLLVPACEDLAPDVAPANIADPGFLAQYAATYRFRLGQPSAITPTAAGDAVLFLRSSGRSFVRDLYELEVATGQEKVLLTAEQILAGAQEKLTAEELARRERMRLAARGITSFELSQDGKWLVVPLSGRLFLLERQTGKIREITRGAGAPIDPRLSPDATRVACVRDGDIYVIDIANGRESRLTTRAGPHVTQGEADFIAQEEMGRMHGLWWSPDGQQLAYQETNTKDLETFHIMDPMHPESPPQSWPYPRAGKNNAAVRLGIISAKGGKTTWVEWDRAQYPYLAAVRWQKRAPLTLVVQSRKQTDEAVLAVDIASGATTLLHREQDEAWVNLAGELPRWLDDGSGFLWLSDHSGTNQLALHDRTGKLVRVLTPPALHVRALVGLSDTQVWVTASEEPAEQHVYRVPLASEGKAEKLTSEPGVHEAIFADGSALYVQVSRTTAGGERWSVRRQDGSVAGELRSAGEKPSFTPNLQLLSVGDQKLRAAVVRPRNFVDGGSYPVIIYVYGGPGHQMVMADLSRYYLPQWLADHGFIVVSLDGRGTPGRGRAFERAIKNNFIETPLVDQAAGLAGLAAEIPEMDTQRVGIFGWSFGGYFSAMAVMRRPDVFHAAVAGAPVSEWRDYDTHYTERYLGLPADNAAGYDDSSVLTHAPKLDQPLLIIHGTADDNVYFMHSIKLSDALFRAGKTHELLPLAGYTHMVPDPLVTTRLYTRIVDFFTDNLL